MRQSILLRLIFFKVFRLTLMMVKVLIDVIYDLFFIMDLKFLLSLKKQKAA